MSTEAVGTDDGSVARIVVAQRSSDEKHETGSVSEIDSAELESRKKRRHEICEQIKALGGAAIG